MERPHIDELIHKMDDKLGETGAPEMIAMIGGAFLVIFSAGVYVGYLIWGH